MLWHLVWRKIGHHNPILFWYWNTVLNRSQTLSHWLIAGFEKRKTFFNQREELVKQRPQIFFVCIWWLSCNFTCSGMISFCSSSRLGSSKPPSIILRAETWKYWHWSHTQQWNIMVNFLFLPNILHLLPFRKTLKFFDHHNMVALVWKMRSFFQNYYYPGKNFDFFQKSQRKPKSQTYHDFQNHSFSFGHFFGPFFRNSSCFHTT